MYLFYHYIHVKTYLKEHERKPNPTAMAQLVPIKTARPNRQLLSRSSGCAVGGLGSRFRSELGRFVMGYGKSMEKSMGNPWKNLWEIYGTFGKSMEKSMGNLWKLGEINKHLWEGSGNYGKHWEVSIGGYPNSWMVYKGKSHLQMDENWR